VSRRFKFCVNCRRTITDTETDRGLYVQTERGAICATCAQRLDEAPLEEGTESIAADVSPRVEAPTQPAVHADASRKQLEEIGGQVEDIRRTLLFGKSSAWNLIAVLAQALALAMLLVAIFRWLDDPVSLLLVALIFQVMALTFFVKASL